MLSEYLAVTTLVVTDIDRAKAFYEEQLGLTLLDDTPAACRFGAGKGSQLTIRRGQTSAGGQTVLHFEVDDIEAVVRDLTSRGVTFEEYETPKTVNFIAQIRSQSRCVVQGPSRQRPRPARRRGPRRRVACSANTTNPTAIPGQAPRIFAASRMTNREAVD